MKNFYAVDVIKKKSSRRLEVVWRLEDQKMFPWLKKIQTELWNCNQFP